MIEFFHPCIPGNVANASTYKLPVRYAVAKGVNSEKLIYKPDESFVEPFVAAARKLQAEGMKAITGAGGFMALFRREIAASVDVPVFASSLPQVDFMHQITGRRVGIICAGSTRLDDAHLKGPGIASAVPLAVRGMEPCEAFTRSIMENIGELDDDGSGSACWRPPASW